LHFWINVIYCLYCQILEQMMLSKEYICKLLESNDKAVARALIVLRNNQTADEQRSETTKYNNGIGVRPCHATMVTSLAAFYEKRGYLSPKQLAWCRIKDKSGTPRLGIYWRQLAEAAEAKKSAVAVSAATSLNTDANVPEPDIRLKQVQPHPDEVEMHRMEAEADHLQTQKEEFLKHIAKRKMEGGYRPKFSNTRL
jgi:hypothetical protein